MWMCKDEYSFGNGDLPKCDNAEGSLKAKYVCVTYKYLVRTSQ